MVTSQVVTVASTVSKQREGSVGPCLALSSLVLGLSLWISAGRIQGGSSVSASLFWGPPHRYTHRFVSMLILNPIELTRSVITGGSEGTMRTPDPKGQIKAIVWVPDGSLSSHP